MNANFTSKWYMCYFLPQAIATINLIVSSLAIGAYILNLVA